MVQNIKVDVIYNNTSTDFEMEFNLSGCCRMRLLTEKTTDKKAFISALARAVSRSRIIIACGPLFEDDGLIKMVGTAIGKGTELINGGDYGIDDKKEISVIKGSTPLVTEQGIFGGCIIESGPQTIIILTENKPLRKQLMKQLIFPYIEDVSMSKPTMQIQKKVEEPVSDKENANNGAQEIEQDPKESQIEQETTIAVEPQADTEPTEDNPEPEKAAVGEHNIDFIFESDTEPEESLPQVIEGDVENMVFEPAKPKQSEDYNYKSFAESDLYFNDNTEQKQSVKKDITLNIPIIIVLVVLLLALGALCYFLFFLPASRGITTSEYLSEVFASAKAESLEVLF